MTAPLLHAGPLSVEQRRLLDQLAPTVARETALWLSGYFAALADRVELSGTDGASLTALAGRRLLVLYGSETGNSADLARRFYTQAETKGLPATLMDMAAYKQRQLAQEQDIVVIVSTHGEGEPPQTAAGFFEFVEGRKAPKLADARFAVLALGDSSYERFCEAGKRLDRRFEELGAERLAERIDCDVDYEDGAANWQQAILDTLGEFRAEVVATQAATPGVIFSAYDKRKPFPASVIENIAIVGRGSSKETRHIELSLAGSGLSYEPGDALGVFAANDANVVSEIINYLGLNGNCSVRTKKAEGTLGAALTNDFEITTATPRFLEFWERRSGAKELTRLLANEHQGERAAFLRCHHIIDIIRRFPVKDLDPSDLLTGLRPLQPRLYSIASSLAFAPDEAHLTIAPVRYVLHESSRAGVATGQLAQRSPVDATLPVYVQANPHFRLPKDDRPIIMIGAGTGVAPYRAFLQERDAHGTRGRSWLFFGERNFRTDFLYQSEWQGFLKDGALSRMDVAFSRDGADKLYVQHRMQERSRDLFAWIEEGANIYVCGDASHMAPDVHDALIQIVSIEGRVNRESAEDYIRNLAADHRYQRDIY